MTAELAANETLGHFEDVTKSLGQNNVLNGLTFQIHKGINGLIGPNGAGKTTTIKLSIGLIKASSGKAEMFGFDCWTQSIEIRRRIGILYEKAVFYEHLTGLEHLKFMAKLKGISDPHRRKALRCLNMLNLMGRHKTSESEPTRQACDSALDWRMHFWVSLTL
jgi:ABC-2 type transport system ATP-binding protein